MKRRRPAAPPPVDGVPPLLALGRCIEVYGTFPGDVIGTFRAWDEAREQWAAEHGLDTRKHYAQLPDVLHDHAPWSYADLAEHDPERLAAKLARAGLPSDWTPVTRLPAVNPTRGPR